MLFSAGVPPAKEQEEEAPVQKQEKVSSQCLVVGAAISSSAPWLARLQDSPSPSSCHLSCLNTPLCLYWSRSSTTCLLYQGDHPVESRQGAVSGTVASSRGCGQGLQEQEQTRVERCSCVSSSHPTSASGYLDPRSLGQEETQLGRLVQLGKPCPWGQDLQCRVEGLEEAAEEVPAVLEAKQPQSVDSVLSISSCLVNDVRLDTGGHMRGGVSVVPTAEDCHSLCLATEGCSYWVWRGDSTSKCFLRREQGAVTRRAGAVSGSSLARLGCNRELGEREGREEKECSCREQRQEEEVDYVGAGLIDPRYLGRIVNRPQCDCSRQGRE